jgi:beta-lactamase class A
MPRPRIAAIGLLCLAMLAGCAPVASQPAPTAAPRPTAPPPTAAPSPTPPPAFAAGSTVGGVDVSGLTLEQAAARLREALAAPAPVRVRAGERTLTLEPAEIGLAAPVDELLKQAAAALAAPGPAAIPAALSVDEAALRARLEALAGELAAPPEIRVITSTDVLSRSFAYAPGRALDVDAAAELLAAKLAAGEPGPFTLELSEDAGPPRVPLERLREEVEALAAEWDGVVGFHLHDLQSGEDVAYQDGSVFAGASTVKTAIMLYAYANVEKFTPTQERALQKMIEESDNIAANALLAAGAGGQGTEYAFIGADEMSTMLQEQLGLKHTYLYVPYETTDYIKLYKPKFRCGPAGPVGAKPYTEMGACLRAEPASMAKLYLMIDQCANGEGLLLEQFPKLSAKRCQEMLDRLSKNEDDTRMVAGVPEGVRVEHKSGWIEDMQADAGIVRSPNGDYILAVYVYKPLTKGRYLWADEVMAPVVAAFSRLVYSAYNPVPLEPAAARP